MSISIAARSVEKAGKPWYAQLWPWLLILGPLTVVIAGSFTMWLAFRSQDALVVGDYYKEGGAINQDLRRDRVAAGLGLSAMLRYDAAKGILSGRVSEHGGMPYAGKLMIRLIHSTLPEKDVALNVQSDGMGHFSATLPMLEMARWQVMIESESREWRLNGVWPWPHEREIMLAADAAPQE